MSIVKKSNQTLSILIRVSSFTDFNKMVIFNSVIKGQFSYRPLLQRFSTTAVNHKISTLHKRRMSVLLNDTTSTFKNMLPKSDDTIFHVKIIKI